MCHKQWCHELWCHERWCHKEWYHKEWCHKQWCHKQWCHKKWCHKKWCHKQSVTLPFPLAPFCLRSGKREIYFRATQKRDPSRCYWQIVRKDFNAHDKSAVSKQKTCRTESRMVYCDMTHSRVALYSKNFKPYPWRACDSTSQGGQMSRVPASHSGRSGNPKIAGPSPEPAGLKHGQVKPKT